jgi:uncharacterized OsmC-like protein
MDCLAHLIKGNPDVAKFKFRASNNWITGTHNRATVKDFYGALQEDDSRKPAVFEIDEPPVLLGNNLGSNPVEYLLVALSGCLTTSLVAHASASVYFKIDADVSDDKKEELVRMAQKYSPVFNTITKSAPVSVHLDK